MTEKYHVFGPDGKAIAILNEQLARIQKISDEQLEALKLSHQVRHMLFEAAKSENITRLGQKMLAELFDTLEYEQQKLWNFPEDGNYHRFFDFPGCSCPKLDNMERLGTPYQVYSKDCDIHGD